MFGGKKDLLVLILAFYCCTEFAMVQTATVEKEGKSHCSKSSFFVQKFNFDFPDFPRKLSIFWGEKLVKMLWFGTF